MNISEMSNEQIHAEIDRIVNLITYPGVVQNAINRDPAFNTEFRELTTKAMGIASRLVVYGEDESTTFPTLGIALSELNNYIHEYQAKQLAHLGACLMALPINEYLTSDEVNTDRTATIEAAERAMKERGIEVPDGASVGAIRPVGKLRDLVQFVGALCGSNEKFAEYQVAALEKVPDELKGTAEAVVLTMIGAMSTALFARIHSEDTIQATMSVVVRTAELFRDFSSLPTLATPVPASEALKVLVNACPERLGMGFNWVSASNAGEPEVEPPAAPVRPTAKIYDFPLSNTVH